MADMLATSRVTSTRSNCSIHSFETRFPQRSSLRISDKIGPRICQTGKTAQPAVSGFHAVRHVMKKISVLVEGDGDGASFVLLINVATVSAPFVI